MNDPDSSTTCKVLRFKNKLQIASFMYRFLLHYREFKKKFPAVWLLGTRFKAEIALVNLVPRSLTGTFFLNYLVVYFGNKNIQNSKQILKSGASVIRLNIFFRR
jgi:hypothetical protein